MSSDMHARAHTHVFAQTMHLRVGERIAYYENHFETENGSSYYTLTFTLSFPHSNDVCYLAHCFPYRSAPALLHAHNR